MPLNDVPVRQVKNPIM